MQKILSFEITMATKDRPKIFQVITLFLFAFSLMTIVVCTLTRLTATDSSHVFKSSREQRYTSLLFPPSPTTAGLQK